MPFAVMNTLQRLSGYQDPGLRSPPAPLGRIDRRAPRPLSRRGVELGDVRSWRFPQHSDQAPQRSGRRPMPPCALGYWLVAALVFTMVVVGGATRLTESGLSITEWQPILGAIPPLSEADWHAAFEKYKATPEYAIVNAGMSLAEFKFIYWWEWTHRLLGRFIGFAFALPFLGFWLAGMLRPGFALKLLGVLALGAPARRDRLVHGDVGARRPRRRQPVPAGAAPADRLQHPRAADLARARRRARATSAAARTDGHARRRFGARAAFRARLRAGRARRARRRPEGRAHLQHLAADGRPVRAAGARHALALVSSTSSRT